MIKHIGTQTIYTGRLILKRFTQDDVDCLFRNWAIDGGVVKFMRIESHINPRGFMHYERKTR